MLAKTAPKGLNLLTKALFITYRATLTIVQPSSKSKTVPKPIIFVPFRDYSCRELIQLTSRQKNCQLIPFIVQIELGNLVKMKKLEAEPRLLDLIETNL